MLLQPTDKFGNPLDPSMLQSFKDGSGLMGSYRDAAKGFGQARLHVVEGDIATSVTQVPYDPTSLFMAAAIAQINQKLDSIQESVDEMFEYMRQRDKANMRGDLKTLADILNGYSFNCGDATYMANAHMKVLDIEHASTRDMELFRSQAQADLKKKGFIEVRDDVKRRLDKVLDYLKDYQLATYIHAFSLFLEPMLTQNFKPAKLADAAAKIEADSLAYRELYTECYDALEASTAGTIDVALLGGIASAGKMLGRAIAATPIGELTPIDEALEGAGEDIGRFNDGKDTRRRAVQAEHNGDRCPLQPPHANRCGRRERLHPACQAAGRVAIRDRHAPRRQLTPPTSPPPSVSAAGRLARGTSWKGVSKLAHLSPTAGGLPGRAGSRGSPRPSLA